MPSFLGRFNNLFSTSSQSSMASAGTAGSRTGFPEPYKSPPGCEKATFAAGCFWGVEHMFCKEFKGKNLYDVRSGYIGGHKDDPTYGAVCSKLTGHAEAVQISYDPKQISYPQLLEYFYKMHDPTTSDQQGPDKGTQYRSAIFYHGSEQERIAKEITRKVNEQWWKGKVVTQVLDGGPMHPSEEDKKNMDIKVKWYDAENDHQKYLDRNPSGYECPSHFLRRFPALT